MIEGPGAEEESAAPPPPAKEEKKAEPPRELTEEEKAAKAIEDIRQVQIVNQPCLSLLIPSLW